MTIKKVFIINPQGKQVFKGTLSSLKFKTTAIKRVALELFNDDNPCIIHESYAVEHLASKVEKTLLLMHKTEIILDDSLIQQMEDLDLSSYKNHTLVLEVKS